MDTICPSCGSNNIEQEVCKHRLPVPYGKPAEWDEHIMHCKDCDEKGDFDNLNDDLVEFAIKKSKDQSVNAILDRLSDLGIKIAYIERALELPSRTISRWRSGKYSASSLALLRTIRTFPWILDVADANFDKKFAEKKIIEQTWHLIYDVIDKKTNNASVKVDIDAYKVNISASFEIEKELPKKEKIVTNYQYLCNAGECHAST